MNMEDTVAPNVFALPGYREQLRRGVLSQRRAHLVARVRAIGRPMLVRRLAQQVCWEWLSRRFALVPVWNRYRVPPCVASMILARVHTAEAGGSIEAPQGSKVCAHGPAARVAQPGTSTVAWGPAHCMSHSQAPAQ